MSQKVRNLTETEYCEYDEQNKYGESRTVTIITSRGRDTYQEMDEHISNHMYRYSYTDYDCSGLWITRRHDLCRAGQFWVIRLYEILDC